MLLSIIIPAYNAEKYIVGCLDSCYQWTTDIADKDLEVIVVDDGSTDQTPTLLQQYASAHSNLRIMHQANQGQSVARNLAIEAAQGEYIYMVDADDAMMGPLPIEQAKSGVYDIIAVQVMYQLENGTRRPWSHQMERWPFGQEFASAADFVRNHNIEGLVYGYLFRRALFAEHPELRFTPGIYHQDEELIFKIFTLAGKTIYTRGYSYLYYEHTGSSLNTRTEARKRKLMDDAMTILRNLVAWRDRFGATDARTQELREVMQYKLSYLSMDILRMLIRGHYDDEYIKQVIAGMSEMGFYPLPSIAEIKYQIMRLLTCRPSLLAWWAKNESISRRIGF